MRNSECPKVLDFKEVADLLRQHRITAVQVARYMNIPRQTVQNWFQGVEPSYSAGSHYLDAVTELINQKRMVLNASPSMGASK